MMDYSKEIDEYLNKLFNIPRSLTGEGNRTTLQALQELIPLEIKEYKSGQQVFDWVVPKEWKVNNAFIKDSSGNILISYEENFLHLIGYSCAFRGIVSYDELVSKLYFIDEQPDAIPYRTTYYKNDWGFCLSHNQFKEKFKAGESYEVCIDASHFDGSMSIGEYIIKGKTEKEILFSTYLCHPNLANDNLSGTILTAFLARELLKTEPNYTIRFVWVPETVGAVAYCFNNQNSIKNVTCGFVVTTVGGQGKIGYKQSFEKAHPINSIIESVMKDTNTEFDIYPFDIHGSDERQYSSPGFRLNMATISKDKYYEYKEYHTSLDNLGFVKGNSIQKTFELYTMAFKRLDSNVKFKSLMPYGEPLLGPRGLYPQTGGAQLPSGAINELDLILWIMFYADGSMSVYDVANKLDVCIDEVYKIVQKLQKNDLLEILY